MEECLDIPTDKNINSWRFGEAQNHAPSFLLGTYIQPVSIHTESNENKLQIALSAL